VAEDDALVAAVDRVDAPERGEEPPPDDPEHPATSSPTRIPLVTVAVRCAPMGLRPDLHRMVATSIHK
jgi:hypothetical protein